MENQPPNKQQEPADKAAARPQVSNVPHMAQNKVPSGAYPPLELTVKLHKDKKLGAGGFGVVYQGETLEQPPQAVAIKMIRLERDDRRRTLQMRSIRNEVDTMRLLQHENIVALLHVCLKTGEDTDAKAANSAKQHICMVMPYCEYKLSILVVRRSSLSVAHFKTITHMLYSALAYMHERGIVHRDVKPDNVLLTASGVLKLADFGGAIYQNLVPGVRVAGTSMYMAPEARVPTSPPSYTTKVDVWSAGLTLYDVWKKWPMFADAESNRRMASAYLAKRDTGTVEERIQHEFQQEVRFRAKVNELVGMETVGYMLNKVLNLDPVQRYSARNVLDMEWFAEVPLPEPLGPYIHRIEPELQTMKQVFIERITATEGER